MITFYTSALLIPLLLAVYLINREYLKWIIALSVPLFSLKVFEFVDHYFTLPEVLIVLLGAEFVFRWNRNGRVGEVQRRSILIASVFLVVGVASIVLLISFPANVQTHPFNSGPLDAFVTRPLYFGSNNVSQSILRFFTFSSIFLICLTYSMEDIYELVPALVGCGVVVGLIGIGYQVAVVTGRTEVIALANSIGFLSWKVLFPYFGSIPRYFSLPGEPGYTAHYFLFLIGLTLTIGVIGDGEPIGKSIAYALTIIFATFLILTGAGTGIGGMLILLSVVGVYLVFIENDRDKVVSFLILVVLIITIFLGVFFVLSDQPVALIGYITQKILFEAGSGVLRENYLEMALGLFLVRPMTGLGFGSFYGASVLGTLLVSTGVLGILLFLLFHGSVIRALIRIRILDQGSKADSTLAVAVAISITTLLCTMLLAKSITALLFPWYWLSVGFGISIVDEFESSIPNSR